MADASDISRRSHRWPSARFAPIVLIVGIVIPVCWWTQFLSGLCNDQARRMFEKDHLGQAEAWLNFSGQLRDGNPETELLLARLNRKLQRLEEFEVHLQRALRTGISLQIARREQILLEASIGRASEHVSELADFMVRQDGDEAEVCAAFVNGFVIAQSIEPAFQLIDVWKQGFPGDPRPYAAKGRIQSYLGKPQLAEEEYRQALERAPDHYPSACLLGRSLREAHAVAEAKSLFERCFSMVWNAAPRIELAKCLRELNEVDRARELLLEVLQTPVEEVAISYLVLGETMVGDPAVAELASLELAANQPARALEYFERAHAADPTDLDIRYGRALALRQTGDLIASARELALVDVARTALSAADALVDAIDPLSPHIEERIRIGEIYLEHGSERVAEHWLKSAVAFAPAAQRAHELLAELYSRRANRDPRFEVLVQRHRRLAGLAPSQRAVPDEMSPSSQDQPQQ